MKAIQYEEFGPSSVLHLVDIPIPTPEEGELLVKVTAAGVNPVDAKIRKGLLTSRVPAIFPVTPGWDFSGVVVERGHGARRFEVGDRVFGYCRRPFIQKGTYAQYIALPESYVAEAPQSIPLEHAAAIPLAGLTAYQSLFKVGHLTKGESLVVYGASGGVGNMAVQLAANAGATVVAIASKQNHDFLKTLGATYTIDYQSEDVTTAVKSLFPNGVSMVFDCYGSTAFTNAFSMVNPAGRVVSILVNQPDKSLLPKPDIEYHYWFVEPNVIDLKSLQSLFDNGKMAVPIAQEFKLSDAAKAHESVETGHTKGKIIITMEE